MYIDGDILAERRLITRWFIRAEFVLVKFAKYTFSITYVRKIAV